MFFAVAVLSCYLHYAANAAPQMSCTPDVKFHVYPTPNTESPSEDATDLLQGHPLTLVFHGFQGDANVPSVQSIKEALKLTKVKNVVVVDWSSLANEKDWTSFIWFSYTKVCKYRLPAAAEQVVNWLKNAMTVNIIRPENVHLIGFSLGAHLSGIVSYKLNSSIGRISGLDPPKLEFGNEPEERLDKEDAKFVNVIHSTSFITGYSSPIGHVDFFPNGGKGSQPGCPYQINVVESARCSHYFAYVVMAESIMNKNAFIATSCDSWRSFSQGQCTSGSTAPMGYATPNTTRGSFFMNTNKQPPFGEEDPNNPLPQSLIDLITYGKDGGPTPLATNYIVISIAIVIANIC